MYLCRYFKFQSQNDFCSTNSEAETRGIPHIPQAPSSIADEIIFKPSLSIPDELSTPPDHTTQLPSFNLEEYNHKPPLASMADIKTSRQQNQESDESSDSDYEEGDVVLARGWPRHHHNLAKHGFRPVWTSRNGYPGDEIPADIREWLDDNGQRSRCYRFLLFLSREPCS